MLRILRAPHLLGAAKTNTANSMGGAGHASPARLTQAIIVSTDGRCSPGPGREATWAVVPVTASIPHSRACTLSVTPGNSRRNSIAA